MEWNGRTDGTTGVFIVVARFLRLQLSLSSLFVNLLAPRSWISVVSFFLSLYPLRSNSAPVKRKQTTIDVVAYLIHAIAAPHFFHVVISRCGFAKIAVVQFMMTGGFPQRTRDFVPKCEQVQT